MRVDAQSGFPAFTVDVSAGGYTWWYVDAVSEDGGHAVTLIAFIGSVFSPYYARARARGTAAALDYCAVNCALYDRPGGWAMTERRAGSVTRSARQLHIGPSSLHWDGEALHIDVRETMVPVPRAMNGRIVVRPRVRTARVFELDAAGRHQWWPLAPVCDVEVDFAAPGLHWRGDGYFDYNLGAEPLADGFSHWHWSRMHAGDGARILYDATRRDGSARCLCLAIDADGQVSEHEAPPCTALPTTRWRVGRQTRAEDGAASVSWTLEDTPFYSRSLIHGRIDGRDWPGMHESLSMDRFCAPWVQCLLPFRMPRALR